MPTFCWHRCQLNKDIRSRLGDTQSDLSGHIVITGIPKAMVGSADLRLGGGRIAGEPFESIVARASFSGAIVNLENVDARLDAGRVTAVGTFNTETHLGDLNVTAQALQVARLAALTGMPGLQSATGTADLTAHISGNLLEKDFASYEITFDAQTNEVTLNGRSVGALALVGRTENKQLNVTLTTGIFGPPQVVTAQVDLSQEGLPSAIDATLNGADLTKLLAIALPNAGVKLSGRTTGHPQGEW